MTDERIEAAFCKYLSEIEVFSLREERLLDMDKDKQWRALFAAGYKAALEAADDKDLQTISRCNACVF
jgi:ribulose bisphosphate carboxylase small subunit